MRNKYEAITVAVKITENGTQKYVEARPDDDHHSHHSLWMRATNSD
jgi:hypothetical protein